jgi:hypothetical protein
MHQGLRKIGTILLGCGIVLAMLPMGNAVAGRDTKAPKIVRAEMLDANGNGLADRIVLNYSEKVKHKLDTDGKYPFQILGPDKASSYKIKKVNATKTSKLVIILRENPNGANKPDVKYTKTRNKPVTDFAGNKAKPQVFIKTIGLPLQATEFTLTINVTGPGKVTSTSAPSQQDQIDCGETCQVTYPKDADVNLSATPLAQGDAFANWAGDCSGTANACVISMDANKTVTATFTAGGEMLLTVTKSGAGKVTSSPSGIDCGATCSKGFPKDQSVTLTATPDSIAGAKFIDWSGACSGVSTTCTVSMDAAKSVTARFAYVLTVVKTGSGTVTSNPAGIACGTVCSFGFAPGTSVALSNVPDAASQSSFVGWSNACTGSGACNVVMDANKTVDATFGFRLTITKQGTGTGTVSSTAPNNSINCGSTCSAAFAAGSSVTLSASASSGQSFTGWGDACQGNVGTTCTVTMNSAKNVIAQFFPAGPFTLTVNVSSVGGSVSDDKGQITNCTSLSPSDGGDCTGSYGGGTVVKLTATADGLFEFTGWSGTGSPCTGVTNPCTVTMDKDQNTTAAFGPAGGLAPQPMAVQTQGTNAGTGTATCAPVACPTSVLPGVPVTVTAVQSNPLAATPTFSDCPTTVVPNDLTKTATCTFNMPNAPTTLHAVFN